MEILADPDLKKALWQDEWRVYCRAGPHDPDCVVLRLQPVFAAGWWGTAPFQLEMGGA